VNDPALRSRKIFLWSCIFALCVLALLFIFFYVSIRCGSALIAEGGATTCMVGIGAFWFEGGFIAVGLFALYRISTLMSGA
jgi:hypothetical protein